MASNKDISRGGKTTKMYNTTNLTYHLRTEHADKYSNYSRLLAEAKETDKGKDTLFEATYAFRVE